MRCNVGVSLVSLLAACQGQAATPATSAAAHVETKPAADARRSPSEAAEAFLGSSAAEASAAIAWEHLSQSSVLFLMGAPEARGTLDSIVQALLQPGAQPVTAEYRREFVKRWAPQKGCAVTEIKTPPLPGSVLSKLPEAYVKTAAALRNAQFLTANCDDERSFRIGVDSSGAIVAFDDTTPVELDPENRFIQYMNEPDEKSAPR